MYGKNVHLLVLELTLTLVLRAAVYKIVASMGQEEDFNTMVKLHNDADLHEEKCRIQRSGIGCFASTPLLAKALEMALSDQVRPLIGQ